MTIAQKLNAWLTPDIRKYIHAAIGLIATIAAIWGLSTDTVNVWVALVTSVGGLGSAILSAIVTRRADMTVLYSFAAAVITSLVVLRFVAPSLAVQIDNTLSAVVAFSSIFAFARTDTSTPTGAPAAEVPPLPGVVSSVVADPVPTASTLVIDNQIIHTPVDPSQPTTTTTL